MNPLDRVCLWLIWAMLLWHMVTSGPAHGATWPRQDVLAKCSVYLPTVRDAKLRRQCLKLSKKMP